MDREDTRQAAGEHDGKKLVIVGEDGSLIDEDGRKVTYADLKSSDYRLSDEAAELFRELMQPAYDALAGSLWEASGLKDAAESAQGAIKQVAEKLSSIAEQALERAFTSRLDRAKRTGNSPLIERELWRGYDSPSARKVMAGEALREHIESITADNPRPTDEITARANIAERTLYRRKSAPLSLSLGEAHLLADAYGVTLAELLGIANREELNILDAFRNDRNGTAKFLRLYGKATKKTKNAIMTLLES